MKRKPLVHRIHVLALVALCVGATLPARAADWYNGFANAIEGGRQTRCFTAVCWGDRNKYGVEPLADLPIGKTFSRDRWGSLAVFENSHDITASFVAGVRFWAFHDWVSLSVYLSKPLYDGNSLIRLRGSSFQYTAGNIRRPYPGVALGLLGDILWVGIDYDQLRNGDGDSNRDLNYPRGQVVSSAFVFTVAILPVTLARNGIGALKKPSGQSQSASEAPKVTVAKAQAEADVAKADAREEQAKADEAMTRAKAAAKTAQEATAKVEALKAAAAKADEQAKPQPAKPEGKPEPGTEEHPKGASPADAPPGARPQPPK